MEVRAKASNKKDNHPTAELDYIMIICTLGSIDWQQDFWTSRFRERWVALNMIITIIIAVTVTAVFTSLKNRRKKLSMNYVLILKTCPNNPAYSCVFEPHL